MTSEALLGIILGSSLGVLGGVVGTYFSIKNTNGPRERAFMVRFSVISWLAVSLFILGLLILPRPYNWLLWIPYAVVLPMAILRGNKKQLEIRREESHG
ncbi:hypothetical protein [Caenimonas soli]|uniref:hypothetical protein n=1 Tax=Caenimonas soli TaxID=2735555 RepID=UPI0015522A9C|nr:hypothetical protein [Caenimonas soli]NPC54442.1 hypothetical protein [Caenimonas soli]